MIDKIFIYGAGGGYYLTYEIRGLDGSLIHGDAAVETAPLSGIYYAQVPGGTAVGFYDMLAYYSGNVLGQAVRFYWDGSDVYDSTSGFTILQLLLKYAGNKTQIDQSTFTLTVYDNDSVTPIKVFDLKDLSGNPSITEVAERIPR